jgi:hypothetical protein
MLLFDQRSVELGRREDVGCIQMNHALHDLDATHRSQAIRSVRPVGRCIADEDGSSRTMVMLSNLRLAETMNLHDFDPGLKRIADRPCATGADHAEAMSEAAIEEPEQGAVVPILEDDDDSRLGTVIL